MLRTVTSFLLVPGFPQKLDAGNQLALIEELHKEIRLIGNESKGEHVPGFCLPRKVSQGLVVQVLWAWPFSTLTLSPWSVVGWLELTSCPGCCSAPSQTVCFFLEVVIWGQGPCSL